MISLLWYPGGKFYMLEDIKEIFDKSGKTCFIDVFGGSGKVLMNLNAKVKVYNDVNNNLVNFFTELKDHKEEFLKKLDYALNSRRLFYEYKTMASDSAENAFRELYSYLMSFAGKGKYYGYTVKSKGNRIINIKENIDNIYNEVKYWTIENIDYKELIKKYDSRDSFFYLDPPYYKIKYYKNNFSDNDFYELKDILDKIKGKYLMNINYNDFIVDLFGDPNKKIEIKNNSVNNKYIKNSKRYELFYYN